MILYYCDNKLACVYKNSCINVYVIMLSMKVKKLVVHSCLTLCYPMDYSSPDSYVHWILQGRILEQLLFPSPGELPDPGIEPRSAALQADSLPSEPQGFHTLYRQLIFYKCWIKLCECKLCDFNIFSYLSVVIYF